jgi:hypothetical protein
MVKSLKKLKELVSRLAAICDECKYFELKNRLIVYEMKLKKFTSECDTKFSSDINNSTSITHKSIVRTTETNRNISQTRVSDESISLHHQKQTASSSNTNSQEDISVKPTVAKYSDLEAAATATSSDLEEYIDEVYTSNVDFTPHQSIMQPAEQSLAIKEKKSEKESALMLNNNNQQMRYRRVNPVSSMSWRHAPMYASFPPPPSPQPSLAQQVTVFTKQTKETSNKSTWVCYYCCFVPQDSKF